MSFAVIPCAIGVLFSKSSFTRMASADSPTCFYFYRKSHFYGRELLLSLERQPGELRFISESKKSHENVTSVQRVIIYSEIFNNHDSSNSCLIDHLLFAVDCPERFLSALLFTIKMCLCLDEIYTVRISRTHAHTQRDTQRHTCTHRCTYHPQICTSHMNT